MALLPRRRGSQFPASYLAWNDRTRRSAPQPGLGRHSAAWTCTAGWGRV